MRVPIANPLARFAAHQAQTEAAALAVLRSGRWVGGPVVEEAERRLAGAFGMRWGVGVGSGTDALLLGLRALDIGPGDRVAVPALGFFATVEAVALLGATPVFVDLLPDRPQWDLAKLEGSVDAYVWAPLFGQWAPVPQAERVLADVAQAIGWGWGRPPGRVATLSLYPSKTVGCAGDGGAVLTDEPALAERIRRLGSHGMSAPNLHAEWGRNSRLDAMQAAVVLPQLDSLSDRIARRRAHAALYDEALSRPLARDPRDAVHHYVLRHPDREGLVRDLDQAGIDSRVYYPLPFDVQPALGGSGRLEDSACPVAAAWCREILAVPVYEDLTEAQVERIVRVLERW